MAGNGKLTIIDLKIMFKPKKIKLKFLYSQLFFSDKTNEILKLN